MRLFTDNLYWVQVNDGNRAAFQLFQRHYSYRKGRKRDLNKHKKNGSRMIGPGETILLIGTDGKAIFAWKKQKYSQNGQAGINCTIFRNEHDAEEKFYLQSSDMILQAEEIAWARWPGERLFTYVAPGKIKSTNPGCCYKKAGWKKCGITKARKYLIFEKYATNRN